MNVEGSTSGGKQNQGNQKRRVEEVAREPGYDKTKRKLGREVTEVEGDASIHCDINNDANDMVSKISNKRKRKGAESSRNVAEENDVPVMNIVALFGLQVVGHGDKPNCFDFRSSPLFLMNRNRLNSI